MVESTVYDTSCSVFCEISEVYRDYKNNLLLIVFISPKLGEVSFQIPRRCMPHLRTNRSYKSLRPAEYLKSIKSFDTRKSGRAVKRYIKSSQRVQTLADYILNL